MRILKRFLILCLLFLCTLLPAFAGDALEILASANESFQYPSIKMELSFTLPKEVNLFDEIKMPQNSELIISIIDVQRELRWHKDGYILCKLKSFRPTPEDAFVDISDKNIYMVVKKYDPIELKEALITGTELAATTAAAFFVPGVDIIYYFTKGAIFEREEKNNYNWFKAGVSNAYENSICWIWLKGKDIVLQPDDMVEMTGVDAADVISLQEKIEKRHKKEAEKLARKEEKKLARANKKKKIEEKSAVATEE